MQIQNRYNLPKSIVEAVKNDSYDRGESDYTVTQLINPPHLEALKWKHDDEIVIDASDRLWAVFGQIGHGILERAEQGAITEKRLYIEVDGSKIGGQFDRLVVNDGLLQDYKFTSIYAVMQPEIKPEWVAQLNMLAHLAGQNGYAIKKLEVVALLRDFSVRHKMSDKYPDTNVKVIDIPFWPDWKTKEYIEERVRLHKEDAPDICEPHERWASMTKYAVKKGTNKKALRLLDSYSEAQSYMQNTGKGTHIEERPGEDRRCMDYCEVCKFCPYWQETYAAPLFDEGGSDA